MTQHSDQPRVSGRTAEYLDLIRQLVTGDHEAYRQRCAGLDATGWEGLGVVVAAAFYRAVHGRFGGDAEPADVSAAIISFVADARTQVSGTGFDVDPSIGESAIRAALTGSGEPVAAMDPVALVQAELLLLWRMLAPLTARELTVFLEDSGALADQWRHETPGTGGPGAGDAAAGR